MKTNWIPIVFACLSFALLAGGCRRKPPVSGSADLETAASKFAAAEAVPTATAPSNTAAVAGPTQEMNQAVQAYKGGQFEDAVTRLQNLRARPGMTGQQYMALNDAMAKVTATLNELAAKGDPRAIEALKKYEQMQTQRR